MNRTKLISLILIAVIVFASCSSHIIDITEALTQTEASKDSNKDDTKKAAENGEGENSGNGPSTERQYFTLTPDTRGIKLILDDDVTLQEYAGSSMNVEGIPIQISNMDWTKKEFVFPFTTQGQTYNVKLAANIIVDDGTPGGNHKWITNTQECVAGGGIDYAQYINPTPLENIQIDVNYDGSSMIVSFMAQAGTVFIDSTPIITPKFEIDLWKGKKDWSHTTMLGYYGYPIANVLDDSNRSITRSFSGIDLSDWASYEYKYWARIYPHFYFDGYGNTQFEIIPGATTAEKTYNP